MLKRLAIGCVASLLLAATTCAPLADEVVVNVTVQQLDVYGSGQQPYDAQWLVDNVEFLPTSSS
jgi:hypothetical protein